MQSYKQSFILSVFSHCLLVFLFLFNVSFDKTVKMQKPPPALSPEVMKATVVDTQQVKNEVARLEKVDAEKKLVEKKRQEKLKEELNKIKEQTLLEQQRIKEAENKAIQIKKEQEQIEQAVQRLKLEKQKISEEVAQKQKTEQIRQEKEKHKLTEQLAQKQKTEQLRKENEKKQEMLLAKIKKEQEQKLQNSLLSEEKLLSESTEVQLIRQKEVDRYTSLQRAKVEKNWIIQENFLGRNLSTKLEIRLARDGRVISVSIVKSSGDDGLDISAKNAVLKASPLPVPEDDKTFENFIRYKFTFRPDELMKGKA